MSNITKRLRDTAQGIDLGADGMGWSPDRCVYSAAADEIDRLRAEVERLRKDAERWRWGVKNAAWHRNEDRSHIAIPVAKDADLSCVAMRVAAIDAAMKP